MIMAAARWPKTQEMFLKWFWQGTNGNNLVMELNSCPFHGDNYIRREKDRPTLYAIVLNDGNFPFKTKTTTQTLQWKLCNVGFTHVSTEEDSDNRMEQVKAQVNSNYKKVNQGAAAEVLFVLPIGAVDTMPYRETEERIRNIVGKPVREEKAKELGLPCSTEWVLTTQSHIKRIKDKIEESKAQKQDITTSILKGFYDPPQPPREIAQYWLPQAPSDSE